MGIVTGYICLTLLFLLLIKFLARRFKWTKIDRTLMKFHKYIAFSFLLVAIVHFILVLKVLAGRHLVITISGIIILVTGLLLTTVCHLLKDRKVEIKFHRAFSMIMAIMLLLHLVVNIADFNAYGKAIDAIDIKEVDLMEVADGTYFGEYDAGFVYAKVSVTVADHKITEVKLLKHITERGKPAEVIINSMVDENRIDVDSVSSATNSSLVIQQACVNALIGK